jgi:N-acetylglutamate synthase-like GNAT family acetyltransferase
MTDDTSNLTFGPASSEDAAYVRERLRAVGMMWEDVDPIRSRFWVAKRQDCIVGFVRLELGCTNALLGSLYTEPAYRKRGIARQLITQAEMHARQAGSQHIFLFSTGAGDFFRAHGYEEVPVALTVQEAADTPQVEWHCANPDLLAMEVTYAKVL